MARIAVVDPLPLFQQGVSAVLSAAEYTVETPIDLVLWARSHQSAIVLLTVRSEPDWDLLDGLCRDASPQAVIAVVDSDLAVSGVRAIRSGARSVVLRDAAPDTLRHAVEATISGQAVMPPEVANALVATGHQTLSAYELTWLRRLSAGVTVVQLASHAGYSERAMYRMLRGLYQRMGVRTRLEAIMRAQDAGWL